MPICDVWGVCAQTLAYLLPVLSLALQRAEQEFEALSSRKKAALAGSLQAVVVVPSRELAMQIARVGQALLPPQARGCVQQAIGGANINRQVTLLLSPSIAHGACGSSMAVCAPTNLLGFAMHPEGATKRSGSQPHALTKENSYATSHHRKYKC